MKIYRSERELNFQHQSLWHMCEDSCSKFQDLKMFGTKNKDCFEWITFGEFFQQVTYFRAGLAKLGVGAGDKVAIIAPNSVPWAVTAYAAFSLNALIVPMYPKQAATEWHYIIKDSDAKVLVYFTNAIDDAIKQIKDKVPTLQHAICIEAPASDPLSYYGLLSYGKDHPVPPIYPTLDDLFGIIYTSGTTANPKGVMLTHKNILANLIALKITHDLKIGDVTLCILPWAHILGQGAELHGLIAVGYATAFNDSPTKIVSNIAEVRPTVLICVPKILNHIYATVQSKVYKQALPIRFLFRLGMNATRDKYEKNRTTLSNRLIHAVADLLIFRGIRAKFGGRLRFVVSGAAALDKKIGLFMLGLGIQVYEGYGLTETSPMVTKNSPKNWRLSSGGHVIPGVAVKIDNSIFGEESEEGEIIAYGPVVMKGYYKLPRETAEVMTEDGGFRTGDLGYVDKEGFLYITGRIKEQYKLENGKYVIPAPIEEKLKLSRFIDNAFVYGEGKAQNVCVVSVNHKTIGDFAREMGLTGPLENLIQMPAVRTLISKEIHRYNKSFRSFERIMNFSLVVKEWTIENDMLTQTLKLKRREIYPQYRDLIESMYDAATGRVVENSLLAVEMRDEALFTKLSKAPSSGHSHK